MFYKSGKVISDQFEPLNMFSFWGKSENGCRGGGFPYSHNTLSQNVNILVKTKNAPKALKHKINFFDMGVPTRGRRGLSQSGNFFPHFPVFVLTISL